MDIILWWFFGFICGTLGVYEAIRRGKAPSPVPTPEPQFIYETQYYEPEPVLPDRSLAGLLRDAMELEEQDRIALAMALADEISDELMELLRQQTAEPGIENERAAVSVQRVSLLRQSRRDMQLD